MTRTLKSKDFAGDALEVARRLIGATLLVDGVGGVIVETEAYDMSDAAAHTHRGPTERNRAMFGPPGHAYIYLIYGLHWCLNLVTGPAGFPAAVLLRALEPLEGLDRMRALRPAARKDTLLASGPARLCQSLAVDGSLNGADVCQPAGEVWVEDRGLPRRRIVTAPRIGVDYAGAWASKPYRFLDASSFHVSIRAPDGRCGSLRRARSVRAV